MQIHTLVPGLHIKDVTVAIHALHGAAASQTSGGSTTYRAVVKDSTGLCTLIYRQGPRCNPAGVRKANCYKVTGHVVQEGGHIVIEASAVEKTHESVTFSHVTDHTNLINFSDQQHLYGVLLLHQQQQQWHVLLSSSTSSSTVKLAAAAAEAAAAAAAGHGSSGSSSSSMVGIKQIHVLPKTPAAPVPLGFITGALSGPAAACRVLDQALQLQNHGSYVLLPLPAAACVLGYSSSSSSGKCIVHLYAAVMQAELPAAVVSNVGQWVPVDQIWQQQQQQQQWLLSEEWQAPIQALLSSTLAFLGGSSGSSSCQGAGENHVCGSSSSSICSVHLSYRTALEAEADNEQQQQQHGDSSSAASTAANGQAAGAVDNADPAAAAAEPGSSSSSSSGEWQPGVINVITQGAGQLQQLLNNIHDQSISSSSSSSGGVAAAAVVHWLAPWAEASTAAEPKLQLLAVTYPHIPVISVNVTVSDNNRDLALEKVMETPQCYRKGGRKFQPVPKLGEKWPCVTLHDLPLLHPIQLYSGPAAGQQLLLALQGMHLLIKPQQHQQQQQQQGRSGSSAAVGGNDQDHRQQQSAAAVQPAAAAAAAAGYGPGAKGHTPQQRQQQKQQQQGLQQITKGATDLKLLLQQLQPHDLLLITWSGSSNSSSSGNCSSGNPLSDQIRDLLSKNAVRHSSSGSGSSDDSLAGRQIMVAAADAAATAANKALAAALKVAAVPTVQVYNNKQLIKAVKLGGVDTAAAAAAKVQAAVLQLQLVPVPQEQPQQVAETNSSSSSSGDNIGGSIAPNAPITAAATSPSSSSSDVIWDPPNGRSAKPGFKRRFPATTVYTAASSSSSSKSSSIKRKPRAAAAAAGVAAVYWPRMPCLNCGCPWWLGEDWDAACARCGWTCENDGYDDDSNVLPEYEERYNMICDSLKQGKTPGGLSPLPEEHC